MTSRLSLKDEEKSARGAQGSVCQLEETGCAKSWTQEDQVHCGWRVGGEPGEVGRGLTTQDFMGCNGETWVGFQGREIGI